MDKTKIIDWILDQSDINEFVDIAEAIKDRKKTLSSKIKYKLSPGMTVNVNGSNKFSEGEITKINKTRAILKVFINEQKYQYNVPFSMLSIKENKNEL
jgi:hypothetical protein